MSVNVWEYRKQNLWSPNGLAILAAGFGIVIGFQALYHNRTSHDTSLSTILATTRNRTLDGLIKDSSQTGAQIVTGLLKAKLVFGILEKRDDSVVATNSVGLPKEIFRLTMK